MKTLRKITAKAKDMKVYVTKNEKQLGKAFDWSLRMLNLGFLIWKYIM